MPCTLCHSARRALWQAVSHAITGNPADTAAAIRSAAALAAQAQRENARIRAMTRR